MGVRIGRRAAFSALLTGWALASAGAQEAPPPAHPAAQLMREACAHVPQPAHLVGGAPTRIADAQVYRTLQRFADSRQDQATVDIRAVEGTARWRRPSFELTIRPPEDPRDMTGAPAPRAWENAFYTVFVRPVQPGAERRGDLAADGAVRANTLAPRPIAEGPQAGAVVVPLDVEPRA